MSASDPRHLRIFLSSPGDVTDERGIARTIIKELPADPLLRDRITVRVIAWEDPDSSTLMPATLSPQQAIDQGLLKPSECDLVIVVLWSRLGTPLDPTQYRRIDGTPYLSGTEYEFEDAMAASRRTGMPLVLVYRRTEVPSIQLDDPGCDEKIEQYRRVKGFFATFQNPDGMWKQSYKQYATPDEFRRQLESDLKQFAGSVAMKVPTSAAQRKLVPIASPDWPGSPFPGLRAFTPEDAPIFFGRGRETDDLVKRLSDPTCRFLAVVGASGSGKSSLVGAGLIPRLKGGAIPGSQDWLLPGWSNDAKQWIGLRFTPGEVGDNPFLALAIKLAPLTGGEPRDMAADMAANPSAPEQFYQETLAEKPRWAELLLFVDQFEELFTLVRPDLRQPFVALLESAACAERVRVVATMRGDSYSRCVELPPLAALLRTSSYPLAAPGPVALSEMITRPAARARLEFEEGLPDRLLRDTGTDPGALALMAYTLDELYRLCKDTGKLSHAAYEALGGVQGAIGARAHHVFDGLDADAQETLPHVFRHLVTVEHDGRATRQRAPLKRVTADLDAARLVDAFVSKRARLLVTSRGADDEPLVEVAHEALLREWPRLAAWITDTKDDHSVLRQMSIAAQQWAEHGRAEGYRWADERLQAVYKAIANLGLDPASDLDAMEREFIRREFDRLLEELEKPDTPHRRRSAIGERLIALGDGGRNTGRRGVGLRPDGLPDIAWCKVPGGEIALEDGKGTFKVALFFIAKHPITYVQFQAFLDAPDGFEYDEWWKGLTQKGIKQKMYEQRFKFDNHPREMVTWYQAVAFCHWLTAMLPADGWPSLLEHPPEERRGVLDHLRDWPQDEGKWEIRLPAEWEWQQAATGGDPANEYPWGTDWDGRFANTYESALSRTTAVGMYPAGAAGCGALDLSGNVWEWCLNEYEKPGNVGLAREARRCLRGGSWDFPEDDARTTVRGGFDPYFRLVNWGFRIVCASPISLDR